MSIDEVPKQNDFSLSAQEAIKKHSIIAKYYFTDTINKGLANMLEQKLFLERIHCQEKYKYLYISPSYYSGEFYINESVFTNSRFSHKDSNWIIGFKNYHKNNFTVLGGADTLFETNGEFTQLKSIPKTLKVYSNGIHIANFNLKYVFKENIKNIPTIPFTERFSLGPLFDKEYY